MQRADAARDAEPSIMSARADAAHCERIVREHARTFALASYFLPAPKRRAAFALYAFCRVADDMVDAAAGAHDESVGRQLAEYERKLSLALAGRPTGPVFRELHWALRKYGVPERALHELVEGVARDLRPVRYETWPELALYCEGVASSVGEMCAYVFGVPGPAEVQRMALRYARALGVAMQLTNILRDVGEDARRGRCYLPEEDLRRFDLCRSEVLAAAAEGAPLATPAAPPLARDERWQALMRFEVERARGIYEAAMPGIALLAADSRRCASACASGYAGILSAIEQNQYDALTRRARLGGWARMSVLWEAWRYPLEIESVPIGAGPTVEWAEARVTSADELVKWA